MSTGCKRDDVEKQFVFDRRQRRSESADEAIEYQLLHLAEALKLNAIVLADDLGYPIAYAGDSRLADLLGQSSMWTAPSAQDQVVDEPLWFWPKDEPAIDPMVLDQIKARYPEAREWEVATGDVELPGVEYQCRVVAIGKQTDNGKVIGQAARGIQRIWLTAEMNDICLD